MPTTEGRYSRRAEPTRRVRKFIVCLPPSLVLNLDEAATSHGFDSRSALVRAACVRLLTDLEKEASRNA